jgi:hypothetical protein
MRRSLSVVAVIVAFPLGLFAAEPTTALPSPVIPDGLGVNIHFTDARPGEMEMLAAGGFRFVRMDFGWQATERAKGEYDFSAYDRLLSSLDKHHIRAVFILDYAHRLYDGGLSPHSDDGRAAFARWAAAAAKHFKGRGVLWEVWNEPNIKQFWKPQPNAEDYAKLALAAAKAIHEAAPGEAVIGPATSRVDLKFLETCFKAGLLEHWAAVSVHPYRQEDPETAGEDYGKLRELMARDAPNGRPLPPVLSGEWGYSATWRRYDEARQGKMLPRQWLTNLSDGVPLSIWYDWKDDGPDPKEPEHHFGTVGYEYHAGREPVYDPKPAYKAAQTLTKSLGGFRFEDRVPVGAPDDYVLRFRKDQEVRLVAWTRAAEPRRITVPGVKPGPYSATGHTGEALPEARATAGGLTLELTDAPRYFATRAGAR